MIKRSLSGAYINKYSIHIQPKKPIFSKHDGRYFAITAPQHQFQALRLHNQQDAHPITSIDDKVEWR